MRWLLIYPLMPVVVSAQFYDILGKILYSKLDFALSSSSVFIHNARWLYCRFNITLVVIAYRIYSISYSFRIFWRLNAITSSYCFRFIFSSSKEKKTKSKQWFTKPVFSAHICNIFLISSIAYMMRWLTDWLPSTTNTVSCIVTCFHVFVRLKTQLFSFYPMQGFGVYIQRGGEVCV